MIKESCGLFGIFGSPRAVPLAVYGLHAQQHRGEEAAGLAWTDGRSLEGAKGLGHVSEALGGLKPGTAHAAIGHTRYSTTGRGGVENAQPLLVTTAAGPIACAHNGNLVNAGLLRTAFEAKGHIFQTTTDSEVIVHLLATPEYQDLADWPRAFGRLQGAYSLVLLTPRALVAVRDPYGMRPLVVGRLGRATVVASETSAFDLVGAKLERDIDPGEALVITSRGRRSLRIPGAEGVRRGPCLFEHVYFARPDSIVFGEPVHAVRHRLGRKLAEEHPAEADLVVPVPDSGNFAAEGFAARSGIPLGHGFIRNHYVGRTFIQPLSDARRDKARIKLNPLKEVVSGKRIVVVDDSIVRGTTAKERVALLREAGAREVHLRISCPPIRNPCYFGIDFPTREELVANQRSLKGIASLLGVDSLGYLSLEGMLACVSRPKGDYCTACWSGDYPMPVSRGHARSAAKGKR